MKTLFSFLAIFTALSVNAGNCWYWLKGAGGAGSEQIKSLAADQYGNIYAVGAFSSQTLVLDTINLQNNSDPGFYDLFIAKFNSAGNVLWARNFGGTESDHAVSVAVDKREGVSAIYIGGSFRSNMISFDSEELYNSGPPYSDYFLLRMDTTGNVVWVEKSQLSPSSDGIYSISPDLTGHIYVAGPFQSDSLKIGSFILHNSNSPDMDFFLAKYNHDGSVDWALAGGGYDEDVINSVNADANGNLYVAGYFESPVIGFEAFTLYNVQPGFADLFFARYDSSGNCLWVNHAGGDNEDAATGIVAGSGGNVFVSGSFRSLSMNLSGNVLVNAGSPFSDLFVAKYDTLGNLQWIKRSQQSPSSDGVRNLCTDTEDNVIFAGLYQSDSIRFENAFLVNTAAPFMEVYLTKYDKNGNHVWTQGMYGAWHDQPWSVVADNNNNIVVGGDFSSPALNAGGYNLLNAGPGENDLFLARMTGTGYPAGTSGMDRSRETVYPGPVRDHMSFSGIKGEYFDVEVFSIAGKKVMQVNDSRNDQPIPVSLNEGIYLYRIMKNGTCLATGKFHVLN